MEEVVSGRQGEKIIGSRNCKRKEREINNSRTARTVLPNHSPN